MEDLSSTRKILEGGSSWAICFLYSVYMQKVVLSPSARIFSASSKVPSIAS